MRCQFEWLQVREDGLHPCQGFSRGTERAWCSCSHTGCDRNWYERERVQYLQVAAWARPKQMSCHCFSGVQFPNSYKSCFGSYIPVQSITEFYSQEVIVGLNCHQQYHQQLILPALDRLISIKGPWGDCLHCFLCGRWQDGGIGGKRTKGTMWDKLLFFFCRGKVN